jgi:hypothetical protein
MLDAGPGPKRQEKPGLTGFGPDEVDLPVDLRARKEPLDHANGIPRLAHLDPVVLPDKG